MTLSPEMTSRAEASLSAPVEEASSVDSLRAELDALDQELLDALTRRKMLSQAIGKQRLADGGPRIVHAREKQIIERYSELGPDGAALALVLLAMGRGKLGRPIE